MESLIGPGTLRSLINDGVIAGIGSVIVFLPQILMLFFFIGLLEDCGYMARAAYLMDRMMSWVGLSGKSFIPLLSSFACAVPGVMARSLAPQPSSDAARDFISMASSKRSSMRSAPVSPISAA